MQRFWGEMSKVGKVILIFFSAVFPFCCRVSRSATMRVPVQTVRQLVCTLPVERGREEGLLFSASAGSEYAAGISWLDRC